MPWWRQVGATEWRVLAATLLGWMLDGMDVMLYAFALPVITKEFGLTGSQAGWLGGVTLLSAALGGSLAGWLADRVGRTRVLMGSILCYSLFTAMIATAHSVPELLLWRTLVGIGLGAEWSAGAVLIAETWPAAHRGKAAGVMQSGWALGYLLAALLSAFVLPVFGWRVLFAIGVLPALLVLYVRRNVPEPKVWTRRVNAKQPLPWGRIGIAAACSSCVLFAYWGLFTWLPSFLASPSGGGLSIMKSSTFTIPVQIGALLGYWSFGLLADRYGRRPIFCGFVFGAALVIPVYAFYARDAALVLLLGILLGGLGHGYFAGFSSMFAELFATPVRATAQGLSYNLGRVASAFAPAIIGATADRFGWAVGLGVTSVAFALSGVLIWLLPETKGRQLDEVPGH